MATITLKTASDGITKSLDEKLDRAKSLQGFFLRNTYVKYQKKQKERWESENASEPDGYKNAGKWESLNPAYALSKKTRFASYLGGGSKMMIATSKLYTAATGQGPGLNVSATNTKLTVAIDLSAIKYARFVSDVRPFMQFGRSSMTEFKEQISRFITKGGL